MQSFVAVSDFIDRNCNEFLCTRFKIVAGTDSVLGYDGCYNSGTSPHGYCTREQQVWQQVISRAVKRGEVQPNIDMQLMAQTFIALFYGRAYRDSLTNGLDADLLKRQMLQLYEAIAHK